MRWCGRYGLSVKEVDPAACDVCLREELLEGTLQADNGEAYPVVGGIPRILDDLYLVLVEGISSDWLNRHRGHLSNAPTEFERLQLKTVKAFGEEWQYFSKTLKEYEQIAQEYFDLLSPQDFSGTVLDAGCGMGRWAYQAAGRSQVLLAVDLSSAVEVARKTLEGTSNAHVIQADLHRLPFKRETFDLIYSLGVLHHLPDPANGLRCLARHLKPHGSLLTYFYYALDNRPRHFHVILPGVTALRLLVCRLPYRVGRWACFLIASMIYWPLIQCGNLLAALGFAKAARQVPLYEFYSGKSFHILFNDSVDRFATSVEFRFSRDQIRGMFSKAGLDEVVFSDTAPFWKALGCRRGSRSRQP